MIQNAVVEAQCFFLLIVQMIFFLTFLVVNWGERGVCKLKKAQNGAAL